MDHHSKYQHTVCPRCGNAFCCTQRADCWCFEKLLPDQLRRYMENHFDDCLCSPCIQELSEMFTSKG